MRDTPGGTTSCSPPIGLPSPASVGLELGPADIPDDANLTGNAAIGRKEQPDPRIAREVDQPGWRVEDVCRRIVLDDRHGLPRRHVELRRHRASGAARSSRASTKLRAPSVVGRLVSRGRSSRRLPIAHCADRDRNVDTSPPARPHLTTSATSEDDRTRGERRLQTRSRPRQCRSAIAGPRNLASHEATRPTAPRALAPDARGEPAHTCPTCLRMGPGRGAQLAAACRGPGPAAQ